MGTPSGIFTISLKKPREKISKFRQFVVNRTVFSISQIDAGGSEVRITSKPLPQLDSGLVTIKFASKKTGFARSTLRKWCANSHVGEYIKSQKSGNLWLLNLALLRKHIKANKLTPRKRSNRQKNQSLESGAS